MNKNAHLIALLFMFLDISTTPLHQLKAVVAQHYSRQNHPGKYLPQQSFPDYAGDDVDYNTGDQQNARNVMWDSVPQSHARISDFPLSASRLLQGSLGEKVPAPPHSNLNVVESWPSSQRRLGQMSGVDLDRSGNVVVFHRGDRVWNSETFSQNNRYLQGHLGPIKDNTIVVFNSSTGKVVNEWGSGIFYVPHGVTVDFEDNVWITDVALHQVFKFPPGGSKKPLLTLGVSFIPANDKEHFCKPTDVAVMSSTGDFFVSDGYCNTRIIKYSKTGKWLLQWGRSSLYTALSFAPYSFNLPHALALVEEKQLLCVADRENGRVLCYDCHNSTYILQIQSEDIGSKIYSVAYTPSQGGLLYLVNSPEKSRPASGFAVNISSTEIIAKFPISGDTSAQPHDIAVSPDGSQVYIVQLSGSKPLKFVKDGTIPRRTTAVLNV